MSSYHISVQPREEKTYLLRRASVQDHLQLRDRTVSKNVCGIYASYNYALQCIQRPLLNMGLLNDASGPLPIYLFFDPDSSWSALLGCLLFVCATLNVMVIVLAITLGTLTVFLRHSDSGNLLSKAMDYAWEDNPHYRLTLAIYTAVSFLLCGYHWIVVLINKRRVDNHDLIQALNFNVRNGVLQNYSNEFWEINVMRHEQIGIAVVDNNNTLAALANKLRIASVYIHLYSDRWNAKYMKSFRIIFSGSVLLLAAIFLRLFGVF